jgi:hypothetical protein
MIMNILQGNILQPDLAGEAEAGVNFLLLFHVRSMYMLKRPAGIMEPRQSMQLKNN